MVRIDRGFALSVWVFIEDGEGNTQGFGGFVIGGTPDAACGNHATQPNMCAEWIISVMRAAGIDSEEDDAPDIHEVIGKAVRVVRAVDNPYGEILGIGHIISNERWFHASERMSQMKDAFKANQSSPLLLDACRQALQLLEVDEENHTNTVDLLRMAIKHAEGGVK